DDKVFDGKVNYALIHQAVVTYLSNQRKGLASTKTRGEVRGGGRKPWRQKGTGRARVGSIRSPLWRKGAIIFGPKPHSYRKEMPKRMKALALKSALNVKFNDREIVVIDDLNLETYKTKELYKMLVNLGLSEQKVKIVTKSMEENLKKAVSNLEYCALEKASTLNTYKALDCKKLLFTVDALKLVEERIKRWLK
ncbi:MAG: 50S ribosomal protein L4, partial [Candidatus Omnitrophica bacterium]|nr:50S ribosomal protein L4 [Candidatus Omnitrophota bacterium]